MCWKTMLIDIVVCCGELSDDSLVAVTKVQKHKVAPLHIFQAFFEKLDGSNKEHVAAYLKSQVFKPNRKKRKVWAFYGILPNAFGSLAFVSLPEGLSRPPKSNNKPYLGKEPMRIRNREWTILWLQLWGLHREFQGSHWSRMKCLEGFHIITRRPHRWSVFKLKTRKAVSFWKDDVGWESGDLAIVKLKNSFLVYQGPKLWGTRFHVPLEGSSFWVQSHYTTVVSSHMGFGYCSGAYSMLQIASISSMACRLTLCQCSFNP